MDALLDAELALGDELPLVVAPLLVVALLLELVLADVRGAGVTGSRLALVALSAGFASTGLVSPRSGALPRIVSEASAV
jgi:hypothetical protein